jgi:TRAP-type C4-dicarboxylate transport system permease small subunit
VHRLLAGWHRAECMLAVAAFALVALLLVADAVGRELLGPLVAALGGSAGAIALVGGTKAAVYALVVGIYAGIGVAAASGAHFVPRVGRGWLPARWNPTIERLGDLVTALVWLAAAVYAAELVRATHASGLRAPMLQWPVWTVQLALPIGFASAALRYLCFAWWPQTRPRRPAGEAV